MLTNRNFSFWKNKKKTPDLVINDFDQFEIDGNRNVKMIKKILIIFRLFFVKWLIFDAVIKM